MLRHSTGNRPHGVFAYAEVQVAPGVTPLPTHGTLHAFGGRGRRLEIAESLQPGVGGRIEIGRAAHQLRNTGRQPLHHRLGGLTGGDAFLVGVKRGKVPIPTLRQRSRRAPRKLGRKIRMLRGVAVEPLLPIRLRPTTPVNRLTEMGVHVLGDEEVQLARPAQSLFCRLELVGSERRAVDLERALLVRRPVADDRPHRDERRPRRFALGQLDRRIDRRRVVPVLNRLHMPSLRQEALPHVLGKGQCGRSSKRDAVVVVKHNQLAQTKMSCQRTRFGRHTLHQIAVACDHAGEMIDDRVVGAVVARCQMRLGNRHPHRV